MSRLALLSLALIAACSARTASHSPGDTTGTGDDGDPTAADADGDGLSDADEATAGTDPDSPDTDGDGLDDGDEATAGTDPLATDTDDDGYSDYDEIQTGHDPTSRRDRIYTGGWPYNPDKDAIDDPGWGGTGQEGDTLPDLVSYDQYGDPFDFYDYANQGKPVIIDVSAGWCYYCQEMAKLLSGQDSLFDDYAASNPGIAQIKDLVDNGDVLWIEVIDQTDAYEQVDQDFLAAWDSTFPNENIAVVADEDQKFAQWLAITGYPTIFALNASFVIKSFDQGDYISPLTWATSHAD
jgi:thiol-disulfide isomerase/thioredoxin